MIFNCLAYSTVSLTHSVLLSCFLLAGLICSDLISIAVFLSNSVNLDVANQRNAALTHVLSSACGLSVLHLPGDGFPDSVFIEDTAVVVGDVALITQPGAVVRCFIP